MRRLMGLWLVLFVAAPAAWAAGSETTASHVFATDSPSIVVVKALNSSGQTIAQGSGVVIAKGVIVSNCHVFEEAGTKSANVFYHEHRYPATLRYGDPEHDLCSFSVKGLKAPPIKMRAASTLKVGENAYAIGAPEGFKLSLSGGLISSLRKISGGLVIQMTTPISPGSSGGGLFDSHARLIGITSYYMKEGQQLNFALPVEWIKALPHHGKTRKQLAEQSPNVQGELQKGVKAYINQDYSTALPIFQHLAKRGNVSAEYYLGQVYLMRGKEKDFHKYMLWTQKSAEGGYIKAQEALGFLYMGTFGGANYQKALNWNLKATKQGSATAPGWLAIMYRLGLGVKRDYPKALEWYRKAVQRGAKSNQEGVGEMYYYGLGVAQDRAKAAVFFSKATQAGQVGGGRAALFLGIMYEYGYGVSQSRAKANYWYGKAGVKGGTSAAAKLAHSYLIEGIKNYSKAIYWYRWGAERGGIKAQGLLAAMYYGGEGVPQNYTAAAKWLIITKAEGFKKSGKLLSKLEKMMTQSQIAKAQRLAREWWAKRHKQ
jgi:TPR repeat protein